MDILKILHQVINQQHGESSFVLPLHSKIDLWKMKIKIKNNVQDFRGIIKYFVKFPSTDNFQDKEVKMSFKISKLVEI